VLEVHAGRQQSPVEGVQLFAANEPSGTGDDIEAVGKRGDQTLELQAPAVGWLQRSEGHDDGHPSARLRG
jgi:hypothetical protein